MSKIIVLLESQEQPLSQDSEQLSITMESPSDAIMNAVAPVILESHGVNVRDSGGGFIYNVRKSTENDIIFIIPKTVAGK